MSDTAHIDGLSVSCDGRSILAVARDLGRRIPTVCHAEGLAPEGGCRICLVELEGREDPVAACHTPLEPGMTVSTDTAALRESRRRLLSLMLERSSVGSLRADPNGSPFEQLLAEYDVAVPAQGVVDPELPLERSHPYLRFDPHRCITCRVCLNTCEQIQGQFVYGIGGRGGVTRLLIGAHDRFADSDCTACGACVVRCPTGALFDRDREAPLPVDVSSTDSICGYCGVGCGIRVLTGPDSVARIDGVAESPVNGGHLCAKGRYAHAWQGHPDRLLRPLLREGSRRYEVSWKTAIDWLADRLDALRAQYGPDSLAAIASSRSTNEAGYLLNKLFRAVIGTNNVDCCARVCHSSTALALGTVTGTGAASASYADIERARLIVVAGANPTEAHPVVGARIKQAVLKGAGLIVIDPRRIELARLADVHLALRPGANVALFNTLASRLIEAEAIDSAYLNERCEGFSELSAFLLPGSVHPEDTGVSEAAIHRAVELLASGPALFVHGLGLSELVSGTASVMGLCNLGMLTGSIGRPGAGMLPLRGQNNVQGQADMGAMPDRLTGYQPLDDPQALARCDELWGVRPPQEPGLTTTLMMRAAESGALKGLWVQGEDMVQSEPEEDRTRDALKQLDLLVVQDLFPCATSELAHLVLPAAGYLEQDGTFTNGGRRVQRVRRTIDPPGEARPDWRVVVDVANAMGAGWDLPTPSVVFDEIAAFAPRLFGGISYRRLEASGLQWPCPDADHPGTETVHRDGFLRGKGRLTVLRPEPNPEHGLADYPFLLITGRVLQHYNVGTMTRRTPSFELEKDDALELADEDARHHGIRSGDKVRVVSQWGSAVVPARISNRTAPGTVFLSFHHPESHTNALTGPHLDPDSRCPQYKVTAVRLERMSS